MNNIRRRLYPRKAACWDQSCEPDPCDGCGGGGGDQTLSISGYQLSISNGNTVTLPSMGGGGGDQTLSFNGGTRLLSISNGNSVTITAQTLSFNAGTRVLTISAGNNVTIPDTDTIQTLSFNAGTRVLSISSGNTVTIPDAQTLSISGNIITISGGNSITIPSSGGGGGAPTYDYEEIVNMPDNITHVQTTNKHTIKFVGELPVNRTILINTPTDTTLGNSLRLSFFEFFFATFGITITVNGDVYTINSNSVLDFEYTLDGWKRVA